MSTQLSVRIQQRETIRGVKVNAPGVRGARGPSAYEVAVAEGFVGTEAQWLASLAADLTDHLADPDAHSQYLTQDEADARYAQIGAPGGPGGATNLDIANRGANTLDITSSTGDDVTLPEATNTQAGLVTAAQVQLIEGAVQDGDSRLDDAREWTASTISQPEAEGGTSTTRRAWTAERVFQAIAAWWAASAAKTKLDGIAVGATANATNAQLRDRQTHTGEQAISTITGLTSALGAKADLVGGVIPTSQIPSVALVEFLGAVANQPAMLLLRGQPGDWAVRTDRATQWVIVANNGASLSDWYELPTGIAPVGSVNGQTGSVTLGTGDIAESGGNLYFTAARAIGAALTGFTAAAGTVLATDSILQAFQKVVGNIAERALSGEIGSSGLTMATNRVLLRGTAGTGAVEEGTLSGGLSITSGALAFTDVIKFRVSNTGETATAANNCVETTVPRACTVVGATWELAPTATGSSASNAMLYARRSGTKTSLLSANASLGSGASFTNVTGTLTGTLTLAAGDTLGVDLVSVGTGSSGHIFTVLIRYSVP